MINIATAMDPHTGLAKAPKFHHFRAVKAENRYHFKLLKFGVIPVESTRLPQEFTKQDLVEASINLIRYMDTHKTQEAYVEHPVVGVWLDEYPAVLPEVSPGYRWRLDNHPTSNTFKLSIMKVRGRSEKPIAREYIYMDDAVRLLGSLEKAKELFRDEFAEFTIHTERTSDYIDRTINHIYRQYCIHTDAYGVRGVYTKNGYKSKVTVKRGKWYEVKTRSEFRTIHYHEFLTSDELDGLIEIAIDRNIKELKNQAKRKKLLGNYPPKSAL